LLLDPDRYGISPDIHDPISAGRLVVTRVRAAISEREDLVLETTLSGHFPLKVLRDARRAGYKVTLVYVGLDDVNECLLRVRRRADSGGHDVPEVDVRRRFFRSLEALPEAITLADRVLLYDNSNEQPYAIVAQMERGRWGVSDAVPRWAESIVTHMRDPLS
jgi:predicted ABC-type ATPase